MAAEFLDAASAAALRRETRDAFREGARQVAPILVVTSVWGLVTGVAMVKSGMSVLVALAITVLVYSGSFQLTVLPLLAAGAPLWLVVVAGLAVNARFFIFGAGLYPFFRDRPLLERMVLNFFNSDAAFAIFMMRYADSPTPASAAQRWFYIGMVLPCWLAWQIFSIAGVFLGSFVPISWSLDFAAILALLAILVPMASSRPMLATMLAAGVVAWLGQALPMRTGLVAAVAVGIVAGMAAERWPGRRTRT